MYRDISRFRQDDIRAGGHMFDRATMRGFGTILRKSGMWRGHCILYNDNAPDDKKYTAYTGNPGRSLAIGHATTKRGARELINEYIAKQK